MKLTLIAVASTVVTLSLSAHAEDMPGMKMDGMEGMQMEQETKQAPVAERRGNDQGYGYCEAYGDHLPRRCSSRAMASDDHGLFRNGRSADRADGRRPCIVFVSTRGW